MNDAIKAIKNRYPWIFYEAYRAAVFAQKDMPVAKITWNSLRNVVDAEQSDSRKGPGAGLSLHVSDRRTAILKRIRLKHKERFDQLTLECKKNQFVFHGKFFIFDAIFHAFGDLSLSAHEITQLRTQCFQWHNDWQNRFLFTNGLKQWCQGFAMSNPEITDMALSLSDKNMDLESLEEVREKFRTTMEVQISKPTFDAVWATFTGLVDYEETFVEAENTLASFFVRLVFLTLTPLMFKHIADEYNKNIRAEIISAYQSLAFEQRFENVDKDIFHWNDHAAKRRKTDTGRTDATLHRNGLRNVWYDEPPPPPPPGHRPGPRY